MLTISRNIDVTIKKSIEHTDGILSEIKCVQFHDTNVYVDQQKVSSEGINLSLAQFTMVNNILNRCAPNPMGVFMNDCPSILGSRFHKYNNDPVRRFNLMTHLGCRNISILKKEEFYRHDHENLERVLRDYKESQNKNYNELLNQISIKENQINTIESSKRKLENNNVTLESKNRDISNQNEILQQILNNMKLKIKNYEELIEELEQKSYYSEKNLKRTKFDKCNSNELLVKILKTKLKCMRDQIASTKNYFKEEINNFKIEIFRMAEDSMISQFNLMKINYERELQNLRVIIKKENQKIIEEKDSYNREEISKMTHKYELKIIDILKRNEVLDNEINKLKVCNKP